MTKAPFSPEERDALAEGLHALLLAHPGGLGLADVAGGLRLSRADAEALLESEQRQLFVDVAYEDGELRFVSLRKLVPSATVGSALAARSRARQVVAERRFRWAALAFGVPLALGSCWLGVPWLERREDSRPVVLPATSKDEAARAEGAATDRRAWQRELGDLERRSAAVRQELAERGCDARWEAGERCYVSHRLLTRAELEGELARMDVRRAALRQTLDRAR